MKCWYAKINFCYVWSALIECAISYLLWENRNDIKYSGTVQSRLMDFTNVAWWSTFWRFSYLNNPIRNPASTIWLLTIGAIGHDCTHLRTQWWSSCARWPSCSSEMKFLSSNQQRQILLTFTSSKLLGTKCIGHANWKQCENSKPCLWSKWFTIHSRNEVTLMSLAPSIYI